MENRIRNAQMTDIPRLQALWKHVFQDDDALISAFFAQLFTPETALVWEEAGHILGALYLPDCVRLIQPTGEQCACTMTYALCTHPAARGRGIGGQLARAATVYSRRQFGAANVLHPAEDGLFHFYARAIDSRTAFFAQEQVFFNLPPVGRVVSVRSVDAADYARIRETYLVGRQHLAFDIRALRFQEYICRACGGGLVAIALDGAAGCAIAEREGDHLQVKELLLDAASAAERVAAALAAHFMAAAVTVRMPARAGETPFGVIAGAADWQPPEGAPAWFGPAFD